MNTHPEEHTSLKLDSPIFIQKQQQSFSISEIKSCTTSDISDKVSKTDSDEGINYDNKYNLQQLQSIPEPKYSWNNENISQIKPFEQSTSYDKTLTSPLCSYYKDYLNEILDKDIVDYSKSNNFIRKDSLHISQQLQPTVQYNYNYINNIKYPFIMIQPTFVNTNYMKDNFNKKTQLNNNDENKNNTNIINNDNKYNKKFPSSKENNNEHEHEKENKSNDNNNNNNNTPEINSCEHKEEIKQKRQQDNNNNNHKVNNNQNDINNPSKNETTHNKFSSKNSHQYNFSHNNNEHFKRKLNRPFTEREGDWICFKCKNLNFAFRTICNRCHEAKNKNGGQTRQFRHFNRNKLFV